MERWDRARAAQGYELEAPVKDGLMDERAAGFAIKFDSLID